MSSDAPSLRLPSSVADILTAAADLIEPPGRWTQGVSARASDGNGVYVGNAGRPRKAVCWCAFGAIHAAAKRKRREAHTWDALDELVDVVGHRAGHSAVDDVACWNDAEGRSQAEVVAALRLAAERVSARKDGASPQ